LTAVNQELVVLFEVSVRGPQSPREPPFRRGALSL